MRFYQKYKIDEHGFGTQEVIFSVSDSYDELFDDLIGIETDIFQLDTLSEDFNILKATAQKEFYHNAVGIALRDFEIGDLIPVQLDGVVRNENYNFLEGGKLLQVRTSTGLNVSTSLLEKSAEEEDCIIILGRTLSPDSFQLDVEKFVL